MGFLYEIRDGKAAPCDISGQLCAALTGPQICSSSDVDEVMGMTLARLHPEEFTPARNDRLQGAVWARGVM
ncbi:hypothetical protein ABZ446_20805 [Streptomyces sp. NPDC005813]|uniref:hypothetical protein n=1 Tax=Streptomyces sp. NPDC005813 TaxID=3155592 RepID=UPI0033E13D53